MNSHNKTDGEHNEGIKAWLEYLDKYRKLSIKLKELTENQEQNLDELDVNGFIERTKEKDKLLSRCKNLADKIFSCKEKYQQELTGEKFDELKALQDEINKNLETALERSKNQEKRLDLLQGDKRQKFQDINKKQAIKGKYFRKKDELKNIDKNKGSRFDEKN